MFLFIKKFSDTQKIKKDLSDMTTFIDGLVQNIAIKNFRLSHADQTIGISLVLLGSGSIINLK